MNKTKLSVVLDYAIPKGTTIKKKQVTLVKSLSNDPYLNQINNCIDAQLLIIESKILTESTL
jgi:hypothetical protein